MNKSKIRRSLFALGAILFSALTFAARASAAIPKKDVWYTQHYMIMQDFERKLYRDLLPEGRKSFQDVFWAARSPEARAKFKARLDYVTKNFWKENSKQPWNTDRGRTYLLNGAPASIDYDQNISFATPMPGQLADNASRSGEDVGANRGEIWIYPYDKYFIRYTFAFVQPSQWRITQTTGNRYLGELETFNKTVTFGITDEAAYKQSLDALARKK
ncbi:MAG TPA: GWxTD domain-containing protein [Acidobacteriota bacterium]|nr:GWxTD domain-containing protein [Acidobacteriota bacterium]